MICNQYVVLKYSLLFLFSYSYFINKHRCCTKVAYDQIVVNIYVCTLDVCIVCVETISQWFDVKKKSKEKRNNDCFNKFGDKALLYSDRYYVLWSNLASFAAFTFCLLIVVFKNSCVT